MVAHHKTVAIANGIFLDLTGVKVSTFFLDSAFRGGDSKNWTILNFTGVKKSKKFFRQKINASIF